MIQEDNFSTVYLFNSFEVRVGLLYYYFVKKLSLDLSDLGAEFFSDYPLTTGP